jgi:hypothetical protein
MSSGSSGGGGLSSGSHPRTEHSSCGMKITGRDGENTPLVLVFAASAVQQLPHGSNYSCRGVTESGENTSHSDWKSTDVTRCTHRIVSVHPRGERPDVSINILVNHNITSPTQVIARFQGRADHIRCGNVYRTRFYRHRDHRVHRALDRLHR